MLTNLTCSSLLVGNWLEPLLNFWSISIVLRSSRMNKNSDKRFLSFLTKFWSLFLTSVWQPCPSLLKFVSKLGGPVQTEERWAVSLSVYFLQNYFSWTKRASFLLRLASSRSGLVFLFLTTTHSLPVVRFETFFKSKFFSFVRSLPTSSSTPTPCSAPTTVAASRTFATMADDGDAAAAAAPGPVANGKAAHKRLSVERIYQKKSQLEHILLRPDTYIGSVQPVTEKMWVVDQATETIVSKEISYVPGLYKIFDEARFFISCSKAYFVLLKLSALASKVKDCQCTAVITELRC